MINSSQNLFLLISQRCPVKKKEPRKAEQDIRFAGLGTKSGLSEPHEAEEWMESNGRAVGVSIRYGVLRSRCLTVGGSRLIRFLAPRYKPSITATRRELKQTYTVRFSAQLTTAPTQRFQKKIFT